MKKLLTTAASIALVSALSISAVAADKLKVGFIYIGPPGDFGWTYQHDQGRQAIDARLGDHAETVFVENVPEGPDAERTITRLARQGAGLIFTTSFGYMDPTLNVAAKFPDVKFEHATGYKRTDNVSTYGARFYEGRYVIGQIAAKMSKSGVAGYIGSFPIPEVVRGINAFLLGAQTVNPDFKLKVVWANSWFDPGREADAAKVLISQGADIITQHTDSTAAVQVAEAQGVYAFGQASDMAAFAPNALLTSIIDNWADYYVDRTQAVLDGSWVSTDTFGGMDTNMVQMGPFVNMPADVKAMAETTTAAITAGELHPFAGPVYKQDGSLAAAEGEVVDLGTLLGMDWYVKGVDDQLQEQLTFQLGNISKKPALSGFFYASKQRHKSVYLQQTSLQFYITQHSDSTAVVKIAEEQGVCAFGKASGMPKLAPKVVLMSIIDNWSDYYIVRTQAVLDGSLAVAHSEIINLASLLGMYWYVQGINDELSN